jgi:hypothetical protein
VRTSLDCNPSKGASSMVLKMMGMHTLWQ